MFSLINFLQEVHPLSDTLLSQLKANISRKRVRRKDLLLREGQICSNIYYVETGLLCKYYSKGEKIIYSSFAFEGQLCTSVGSFTRQRYGIETIEALENSSLYYISFEQYLRYNKLFPEFNAISRILLEKCLDLREERMAAMWMRPAQERYEWLINQYPKTLARLNGKQLCSYLGMTAVMLSRLKKQNGRRIQ